MPFPVRAVQCDGGHEFRGAFAEAAAATGIAQFINRPNYPQGNGRVERSFLTDDEEFHEVEGLATTAEGLDRQLAVRNQIYEEIWFHQSLGYLTPNEFYAQWVAEQTAATTGLSEMSLTPAHGVDANYQVDCIARRTGSCCSEAERRHLSMLG